MSSQRKLHGAYEHWGFCALHPRTCTSKFSACFIIVFRSKRTREVQRKSKPYALSVGDSRRARCSFRPCPQAVKQGVKMKWEFVEIWEVNHINLISRTTSSSCSCHPHRGGSPDQDLMPWRRRALKLLWIERCLSYAKPVCGATKLDREEPPTAAGEMEASARLAEECGPLRKILLTSHVWKLHHLAEINLHAHQVPNFTGRRLDVCMRPWYSHSESHPHVSSHAACRLL